jgi:mono/diheme cytochrome c family protein
MPLLHIIEHWLAKARHGFRLKSVHRRMSCRYADLSRKSMGALATILLAFSGSAIPDLENHPGKAIYERLCTECHGPNGEPVKDHTDEALWGNRDLPALTQRIVKTMPEDEEEKCVGAEAEAVAEYIYHAFYSLAARARKTPARIDLTRLTVPQFRNAIADLILGFRGKIEIGDKRGLMAGYYGGYRFNTATKGKGKFDSHDDIVRFDFGENLPLKVIEQKDKGEFTTESFAIRWEGALLPETTGVYEFVIRTRNGATLWVNQHEVDYNIFYGRKTIDGYVAPSNELRELKASVFLIGGRPYPIRLEFFKYKTSKAQVELLWKPPHGVLHTIPRDNLAPYKVLDSQTIATAFPPDDRSVGYERGSSVSNAWLAAVTRGASEASAYVVRHIDQLARTKEDAPDRAQKIKEFADEFVIRAFRRPLSEDERKRFVERHFEQAKDLDQAIKRLVLFALTSPRFLYQGFPGEQPPDQWETASRLALALWDSLPDKTLRDAAQAGKLGSPEQLANFAESMVRNWRSRAKLRGFFHHWLELERADDIAKDKQVYPEFDEALLADLRTSLNLFLDDAVWGETSDYRHLLQADYLYLNERLGKLYGKPEIKGGFQRVSLDSKQRSGIITHPFLLTSLAYHNNTSPIHRGVFLTRNIVGMTLKSPPMANVFKEGEFDPSQTMREKVTEMTRARACMGCHVTINPLGFSLEHYDGIGRWRTQDQDKPIDATSDFTTEAGQTITLTGARDVANFAAETPSAHRAFIQQLFHHLVKQPVRAYGPDTMETLHKEFVAKQFNVPHLLQRIAMIAALHGQQ